MILLSYFTKNLKDNAITGKVQIRLKTNTQTEFSNVGTASAATADRTNPA